MIRTLSIEQFLNLNSAIPVADVRTPAEFSQGHMPAAHHIPLFSNEERARVGTTYKQCSREEAVLLGFELTGPKWSGFIRQAAEIAPERRIALYCWRGGMRSGAMAWAFNLYGFDVFLLEGGYKSFRKWVLERFADRYQLLILGGMTGSGKTRILHELRRAGEQVVDLEDLAQHQGSSYGTMNKLVQPTQEQFENDLAAALRQADPGKPIWLEDESLTIGKRMIPNALWQQMRTAPLIKVNVPLVDRIASLAAEYGGLDPEFLSVCTERISRRLGPEQTRNALLAIREGRMSDFVAIVLVYYDKTYRTGISKRRPESILELDCTGADPVQNAGRILCRLAEMRQEAPFLLI